MIFVWLHIVVYMEFVSGQPDQWFAAGCHGRNQTLQLSDALANQLCF
jgi:hypothetical protein